MVKTTTTLTKMDKISKSIRRMEKFYRIIISENLEVTTIKHMKMIHIMKQRKIYGFVMEVKQMD